MHRHVSIPLRLTAAAAAVFLVAGACGSSKKDDALRAEQGPPNASSAQPAPTEDPAPADVTASTEPLAATAAVPSGDGPPSAGSPNSPGSPGAANPAGAVAAPAIRSPQATGTARDSGTPAQATAAGGGSPSSPRAPVPTPDQPGPGGGPAPSAPQGPKDPIKVGVMVTGSGPIGTAIAPILAGGKIWIADVNARGGLNGHPVQPVFGDDGGDPNRALVLAKRMVEQDKVVLFYASAGPITLQAVAPYLEQKKVPLFELCSCNNVVDTSPMIFPVAQGATEGTMYAHILPLIRQSDKRKIAVFYCREVNSCAYAADGIERNQQALGYQVVYKVQVSLAQPDFTAEVIAARNAGADAIATTIDVNSNIRVERAAHRQGWNPAMSGNFNAADERFLKSGGADVEGFYTSSQVPLWTSPLQAEYREAAKKYDPGIQHASFTTIAWANGKLLEKLAQRFTASTVTSNDVLEAIYALRGETLGGLVPPLTYKRDSGHGDTNQCTVPIRVEKGKFVPWKDGGWNEGAFACPPSWKPVQP